MIRAGLLTLALAGPATADALCPAAWARVGAALADLGAVSGTVGQDGGWCVVDGAVLNLDGQYLPDWHMDRLRFRGPALGWLVEGTGAPEGLEVAVEGLRPVIETGNAQFDWLYAAQARAHRIRAEAALSWEPDARVLRLEGLSIDFPGENLVEGSAVLTGVDLSSAGAMQKSLGSFALTRADLRVVTHGLFEGYLLMPLGSALLPAEGDMPAAAEGVRVGLAAALDSVPEANLSKAGKAALGTLIAELPNPAGTLVLSLRAEPGIGPVRLAGRAPGGGADNLAEAAPLLQGVVMDVDWTHSDAP